VNLDRAASATSINSLLEAKLLEARASAFSSIFVRLGLMRLGKRVYKDRRAVHIRTGTTQTPTSAPPRVGQHGTLVRYRREQGINGPALACEQGSYPRGR